MNCRVCQRQIDMSSPFTLIDLCSDHIDAHLDSAQKKMIKTLTDSLNSFELKKKSAKNHKTERELRKNELIKQGLLIYKDPNNFDIQEKKIYLDSMQIKEFDRIFGLGKEDRDYIQDITFSNDKRFSFVCKNYLGN